MTKAKKAESTSKEVAILSPEEQAYLDSLKVASSESNEDTLPRLLINTASKDADGNKRPIGAWHITGLDMYVDDTIYFRPIRHRNKLIRYSVDESNNYSLAGESIYFQNYSEEIPDSLGGNALGRKFGRSYSDEEKEATKALANVYLDIFGFVYLNEDLSDEPMLVRFRTRGTKMMTMLNAFKGVPKGSMFSEYVYALSTDQPEGKIYWDVKVQPLVQTKLSISPILQADSEIMQYVNESNLRILNAHKRKSSTDTLVEANTTTIEAILDDELPF